MGSTFACCMSNSSINSEDFIVKLLQSLPLTKIPFEKIFSDLFNKEYNIENVKNLNPNKIHLIDLKRLLQPFFVDESDHEKFLNLQKNIFDHIVDIYLSKPEKLNIKDLLSVILYFSNNSKDYKAEVFYHIHESKFISNKEFKLVYLNYIQDVLFFLTFIPEYTGYFNLPEDLTLHLSIFRSENVELYFREAFKEEITHLEDDSAFSLKDVKNIISHSNFAFDLVQIRDVYLAQYGDKVNPDFTNDHCKKTLETYILNKKSLPKK